jgi:hypothetical protein
LLAKYGDLLHPPDFEGGNQQEVYDFAREAVHKSLKDGLFLRGGTDENVKFILFYCFLFMFHVYVRRTSARTLHIQQSLL